MAGRKESTVTGHWYLHHCEAHYVRVPTFLLYGQVPWALEEERPRCFKGSDTNMKRSHIGSEKKKRASR